ncbi:MAG: FAD-dependent oxidoreductase [Anaerolineae bacterium]
MRYEIRVGLRLRTADNMPVLGSVPGVEGVYLSTGHGASGLQLGPFSGKLAAEWALGVASGVILLRSIKHSGCRQHLVIPNRHCHHPNSYLSESFHP